MMKGRHDSFNDNRFDFRVFFSTTFVLNHMMSLGGGHWFWSGALRYGYMLFLLGGWITVTRGFSFLQVTLKELRQNLVFWIISGSIGFGAFYALICFSADHSPGWVVATTWQLTIIASLFILLGFGRRFPKKIWAWALVVFGGVCLVNLGHFEASNLKSLLMGDIPVLVAILSGVVATSLFLYARGKADTPAKLAAVDATQCSEVVFALAGEVLFLGAALPNAIGITGIIITGMGLIAFARSSK